MLESSEIRKNPRAGEKLSRHDVGLSAEARPTKARGEDDNFKKFDEILLTKGASTGLNRGKTIMTVMTTMGDEDDDEPNYADVKEKLKVYTTKNSNVVNNNLNNEGQKGIKSFFSGVKNLFS